MRIAGLWSWRVAKAAATAVYAGCCYHVVTNHIVTLATCEQQSMYPTINSTDKNDVILVNLISRKRERGDIVILHQPDSPNDLICKRITQVAGDRIPQSHHALHKISVVPRGHVWVEGDCKHMSYDSRHFGPVPLALVCGRVMVRVWPPSQVGWVI